MITFTYKVLTTVGSSLDWRHSTYRSRLTYEDRYLYTFSEIVAYGRPLIMLDSFNYRSRLDNWRAEIGRSNLEVMKILEEIEGKNRQ